MQTQLPETYAMSNYVIVEATCRVCGKVRAKISLEGSERPHRCPRCRRRCECVYAGHGFSSDARVDSQRSDGASRVLMPPVF